MSLSLLIILLSGAIPFPLWMTSWASLWLHKLLDNSPTIASNHKHDLIYNLKHPLLCYDQKLELDLKWKHSCLHVLMGRSLPLVGCLQCKKAQARLERGQRTNFPQRACLFKMVACPQEVVGVGVDANLFLYRTFWSLGTPSWNPPGITPLSWSEPQPWLDSHCPPLVAAPTGIVMCAYHLLSLVDHVLEWDPFENNPRLAPQS